MRHSRPLPVRLDLPLEIFALPPGHLNLSANANRYAGKFRTIRDLTNALNGPSMTMAYAEKARREIRSQLMKLSAAVQEIGIAGWDSFRASAARPSATNAIYFYSPTLTKIQGALVRTELGSLHLSTRAITALKRSGIATIAALIKSAGYGIEHLVCCGSLTATEIVDSLAALSQNVREQGVIDWIGYARRRGFLILPEIVQYEWDPAQFVQKLPYIANKIVQIRYGADDLVVLRSRLLRPLHRQISLKTVGGQLGQTREEARLTEQRVIKLFRSIILNDDYQGCRFRIRSEFLAPIRRLATYFAANYRGPLFVSEWEGYLSEFWRISVRRLARTERLILEILGYGNLGVRSYGPSIPRTRIRQMRMRLRAEEQATKSTGGSEFNPFVGSES